MSSADLLPGSPSLAVQNQVVSSSVQSFLAGGVAGTAYVLCNHPFDTLRVRLQTSNAYSGLLDCVKKTGFRGLYKGMASPLLGNTPTWAISFWAYDLGQHILKSIKSTERLTYSDYAIAGAFAGIPTNIITTPIERLKVIMQTQDQHHRPSSPLSQSQSQSQIQVQSQSQRSRHQHHQVHHPTHPLQNQNHISHNHNHLHPSNMKARYPTMFHAAVGVLRKEGLFHGLYRGAFATLARDVPGASAYFITYEYVRRQLGSFHHSDQDHGSENGDDSTTAVLIAGGFAGVAQWTIAIPPDVIKSRIQAAPMGTYSGFSDACIKTLQKEGPRAFFRGWLPAVVTAFPVNAVALMARSWTLAMFASYTHS